MSTLHYLLNVVNQKHSWVIKLCLKLVVKMRNISLFRLVTQGPYAMFTHSVGGSLWNYHTHISQKSGEHINSPRTVYCLPVAAAVCLCIFKSRSHIPLPGAGTHSQDEWYLIKPVTGHHRSSSGNWGKSNCLSHEHKHTLKTHQKKKYNTGEAGLILTVCGGVNICQWVVSACAHTD